MAHAVLLQPSHGTLHQDVRVCRHTLLANWFPVLKFSAVPICFGLQDDAVPVAIGQRLFEQLPAQDMVLTLVKDGDHRLARPQDIRLTLSTLDNLVQGL